MTETITVAEFRARYVDKVVVKSDTPRKSKYKNVKTEVNGVKFDSVHESKRYGILKLREKANEITALSLQVPFNLGEKSYRADFVYFDRLKMQWVVEDAKGTKTSEYIHKRKLMKKIYNIEILET